MAHQEELEATFWILNSLKMGWEWLPILQMEILSQRLGSDQFNISCMRKGQGWETHRPSGPAAILEDAIPRGHRETAERALVTPPIRHRAQGHGHPLTLHRLFAKSSPRAGIWLL